MKLHLLIGSALVFGIPLASLGLQRLYPESKVAAGCAAAATGDPTPAPDPELCRKCDPTPCTPPPGGSRSETGVFYRKSTCIDWDGIWPPHCLSTVMWQYQMYDASDGDDGTCFEALCAEASGSNPPACSSGYHP